MRNTSTDKGAKGGNPPLSPPLWVWAATASVCLVIGVLFFLAFRNFLSEEKKDFASSGLERIGAFSQSGGGAQRVIALGTSLMYFDTFFDGKMDAFARSQGHGRLRFLRIARARGSFEYFTPMLDGILAARPDVIIIEHDLLFYQWDEAGQDLPGFIKEKIKALLGVSFKPNPLNFLEDKLEPDITAQDPAGFADPEKFIAMRPLAAVWNGEVEDFLKRAGDRGIIVVLLKMPRTPTTESIMAPEADKGVIEARMKRYRGLGIGELIFPEALDTSHYLDYSHLNEKGRERFSRWLVIRLEELGREAGR